MAIGQTEPGCETLLIVCVERNLGDSAANRPRIRKLPTRVKNVQIQIILFRLGPFETVRRLTYPCYSRFSRRSCLILATYSENMAGLSLFKIIQDLVLLLLTILDFSIYCWPFSFYFRTFLLLIWPYLRFIKIKI